MSIVDTSYQLKHKQRQILEALLLEIFIQAPPEDQLILQSAVEEILEQQSSR